MEPGAVPVMPDPRQSGHSAELRQICLILVASWALPGAASCAIGLVLSALPAPTPDGRSLPAWFWIVLIPVVITLPLPVLIPVPLLIVGLVQLRRAAPGWRWPAAWTGVMAVAIALATALVLAIAHALQPSGISYPVPARLSWGWLTLIIAFIATAAAMTWVLRARRPAGYSVNVG